MNTISVREAAKALGITPRAVTYRLDKGPLNGKLLDKNEFGTPEWRVFPNKEIMEGLKKLSEEPVDTEVIGSAVEAEAVEGESMDFSADPRNDMARLKKVVDELMSPVLDRVEQQASIIAEQNRIIDEKDRALKLIPDLQKQAETEHKEAELRALEIEAVRKQITAIEEEKKLLAEKANESTALANDLQSLQAKVKELETPWWKKWFMPAPAEQ